GRSQGGQEPLQGARRRDRGALRGLQEAPPRDRSHREIGAEGCAQNSGSLLFGRGCERLGLWRGAGGGSRRSRSKQAPGTFQRLRSRSVATTNWAVTGSW